MREEREGVPSTTQAGESVYRSQPMPFRERFETMRVTPQKIADLVIEENGRFAGLTVEGERYKPSQRLLKGLAQRMKVPLSVFELFTPLEVIRRAGQRVQKSGVLDRIGHEVETRYPGMASRIRECLRSPLRSSKQLDFVIFRKILDELR